MFSVLILQYARESQESVTYELAILLHSQVDLVNEGSTGILQQKPSKNQVFGRPGNTGLYVAIWGVTR